MVGFERLFYFRILVGDRCEGIIAVYAGDWEYAEKKANEVMSYPGAHIERRIGA